jgi:hypothetical protein
MEKRGKEIILLALALILIAVTAFTLIPRKAKAPQAVAAVNTTDQGETAGNETKTADDGNKTDMPAPGELLGAPSGASPNRNPFAAPATAATPVATATTRGASAIPAASGAATTGTGNLPPLFPQNPVAALGIPPVEVLQFTGVLQGNNEPMAIMRRGESRYFVGVGDYVDNYRVNSIGSDRITLKSKEGKQIILHLGRGA